CRSAREHKLRHKTEVKPGTAVAYPSNVTLKNLYYFIFAPTLCYELRFPRTPTRRKSFMLKRAAELFTLSCIIAALFQQWVVPLLINSVEPFSTMNISHCVERVLKLAIPNHVIWLICFYTVFHSFLNLIAEILRFADRQFYLLVLIARCFANFHSFFCEIFTDNFFISKLVSFLIMCCV
ncbi:unnamed protein product, partial [Anisakis simplex]|uniref:diacylglycerol O-acyltransferase n=1 Tax=Anisakis simplex TaxID=6269 RepID=A0A0M3J9Q4_ANISI